MQKKYEHFFQLSKQKNTVKIGHKIQIPYPQEFS